MISDLAGEPVRIEREQKTAPVMLSPNRNPIALDYTRPQPDAAVYL